MPSARHAVVCALAAVMLLLACQREPTAPDGDEATSPMAVDASGWAVDTATGPISSLLRTLDPAHFRLEGVEEATWRFRQLDPEASDLRPGEIIQGQYGDSTYLRRVLAVEHSGDLLAITTGSAFLHDVIRGGRYAFAGGPVPDGAAAFSRARPPVSIDTAFVLDSLDLCAELATQRGSVICGSEKQIFDKGVIELEGQIDTLLVEAGIVDLAAELDAVYTLDPGGVVVPGTGRAPVFTPCNTTPNATGCFARVGSALRSFLGSVGIDPNVLPPARMCVPGTPVVVRPVQWWPYRAAVTERCRVADWGALPEFSLPTLEAVTVELRPRIHADMIVNLAGSGTLELTLPVPTMSKVKCFDHGNGFLCLKIGLVMPIAFSAEGLGARAHLDDLEHDRITLQWTDADGWSRSMEALDRDHNFDLLKLELPDTLTIRVGAAVTAEISLCLGPNSHSDCIDQGDDDAEGAGPLVDLKIGGKGEVTIGNYIEGKASFDDEYLNLNMPMQRYNALEVEFGLLPPKLLIKPGKNLHTNWPEFDCCHLDLGSYHGTGSLGVRTLTGGALPDPDGYRVLVRRVDTLPNLSPAGTRRIGRASWEHPFDEPIGTSDSLRLDPWPMCRVIYSDALIATAPIGPLHLFPAARRRGANVPNFVMDIGCDLIPADYEVELVGLADNCTVDGGRVRAVRVRPSYLEPLAPPVAFTIDCPAPSATPGAIGVTVATVVHGSTPAGFALRVDGGDPVSAPINGSVALPGLEPRPARALELLDLPESCVVAGSNPRSVAVTAGITTNVQFDVECFPIVVEQASQGNLEVRAVTTGENLDSDGYALALDGAGQGSVPANGSRQFASLDAGSHLVALTGLAPNCSATGANPASVQVVGGGTTVVTMDVTCRATDLGEITGSVAVTVVTGGQEPDADGYVLRVGSLDGAVPSSGTTTVDLVSVGQAEVRLDGVAPQCRVEGEHPRMVTVVAGQVAPVALQVTCGAGTVAVTVTTSGVAPDTDGYGVLVDGSYLGALTVEGTATFGPLADGAHELALGGLAPNCSVRGGAPRRFETTDGSGAQVDLTVDCVPTAQLGTLNVSAWWLGGAGPEGTRVLVDGQERGVLDARGRATIPLMAPGGRRVSLAGLPDGCAVTSDHPRQVRQPPRWTVSVGLVVRCR